MNYDDRDALGDAQARGGGDPQAEALADVLRDAEAQSLAELATKGDLASLWAELKADMARLRTEIAQLRTGLEADLVQLEQRMTIRLGAMMAVALASVAALVRLLLGRSRRRAEDCRRGVGHLSTGSKSAFGYEA